MAVRLRKLCPDGVLKVIRPRTKDGDELRPGTSRSKAWTKHRAAFLKAMNIEHHDWPEVEGSS